MKHPLKPRTNDRRLQRGTGFWLNRLTSQLRVLPDFLIIGEMKSGTSSLYYYLQRHPSIARPMRKEVHYFDIGYHKGPGWYRSHFPQRRNLSPGTLTGEACPDYLFCPDAQRRIYELLPNVRMVVLLRDPVERAVSHYYHEVRMGREYLPLMDALKAEEERLAESRIEEAQGLETYLHASYKRRGRYADQLERYFSVFPREQILILGNNQLKQSPHETTNEVLDFLSLPRLGTVDEFSRANVGNRGEIPSTVSSYLNEYFEPHNHRLFAMLDKPVDW